MSKKRAPIGPKIRFEVFKRDRFTCQYCGSSSPEVILHIEHVKPVSKGGHDDMLNLVTACSRCNLGKGGRELADGSAVMVQKAALDEMQERRNQVALQRMWRDELEQIREQYLEDVQAIFMRGCPGKKLTDIGLLTIRKYFNKFGEINVIDAAEVAVDTYVRIIDGVADSRSIDEALSKIGGICYNWSRTGRNTR